MSIQIQSLNLATSSLSEATDELRNVREAAEGWLQGYRVLKGQAPFKWSPVPVEEKPELLELLTPVTKDWSSGQSSSERLPMRRSTGWDLSDFNVYFRRGGTSLKFGGRQAERARYRRSGKETRHLNAR